MRWGTYRLERNWEDQFGQRIFFTAWLSCRKPGVNALLIVFGRIASVERLFL